jgi:hypothetical protein
VTKQEFKGLLDPGHETNGVEFKAAAARANPYLAGVVRAMLGMANRRDGGLVIDRGNAMSVAQEQSTLVKIRTRGYWRVVIRPAKFEAEHVPNYRDLFSIVQKNSVQLRGWDYPHIDYKSDPLRGAEWVGQEFDVQDEIEVWRISQSGQFVHFFTIFGDWRDRSRTWPAEPEWKHGHFLYYTPTVFSLVEIFEFAARMALSPAGAPGMHVDIEIHGLRGRRVISIDQMVPVSGNYTTEMPDWAYRWDGSQTDLMSRPRELASDAAIALFDRFGLQLSPQILRRVQDRIGR